MNRTLTAFAIVLMTLTIPATAAEKPAAKPEWKALAGEWVSLFDGTMGKWKPTDFGGQAEVKIEGEALILPIGNDMTGVTYTGPIPMIDYEIELEAARIAGNDFFCGLTFPVNKSCASLILGGWGGSVCGISSLDGYDASDNPTTTIQQFKKDQWYRVRVRVTEKRLQAWLDKEQIVNVEIGNRKVDVRLEVEPSKPLGIATWQTAGKVRNIRMRTLMRDEIEEANKPMEDRL